MHESFGIAMLNMEIQASEMSCIMTACTVKFWAIITSQYLDDRPRVPETDRTGTISFMAIELLTDEYWNGKIEQLCRDELEAFIWILSAIPEWEISARSTRRSVDVI